MSRARSAGGATAVFVTGIVIGWAGGYLSAPMFPTPPLSKFSAAPQDGVPPDLTPTDLPERPTTHDTHLGVPARPDASRQVGSTPRQAVPEGRGDQAGDSKTKTIAEPAKTAVEPPSKVRSDDARTNPDMREESEGKQTSGAPPRPDLTRGDRAQERRRHRSDQQKFADGSEDGPPPRRRSGRERDQEPSRKQRETGGGCFLFFC
jgi:hypothetical protein